MKLSMCGKIICLTAFSSLCALLLLMGTSHSASASRALQPVGLQPGVGPSQCIIAPCSSYPQSPSSPGPYSTGSTGTTGPWGGGTTSPTQLPWWQTRPSSFAYPQSPWWQTQSGSSSWGSGSTGVGGYGGTGTSGWSGSVGTGGYGGTVNVDRPVVYHRCGSSLLGIHYRCGAVTLGPRSSR